MTSANSGRRGLTWAIIGGLVLVAGIVAIIIGALLAQRTPTPTDPTGEPTTQPTPPTTPGDDAVVDASVADHGWRPEPITTDPETYVRAALAAASTFDTTLSDTRRVARLPRHLVHARHPLRLRGRPGRRDGRRRSSSFARESCFREAEWDSLAERRWSGRRRGSR